MSRSPAGPASRAIMDPEIEAAAKVVMSRRGLRLTRHRRTILTTISLADHPLSTAEVADGCGVPLSTAYRNLTQLVDGGVVARVVGGDRTAYHELTEALTNDHRHHLVCLVCGMVGDFVPSRRLEVSIRAEARRLLNTLGFDASMHIFDVQGRCNSCR